MDTPLSYATPQELRADAIVIGTSRKFLLMGMVGGAAAAGLGCYMLIAIPMPSLRVSWLFLLMGALFVVGGLWELFDKRPRMIVDDDGFTDCKYSLGRVTWDQISGVRTGKFKGMPYLYVLFKDEEVGRKRTKESRLPMARPNDALPHEATLSIGALVVRPTDLIEMMQERINRKNASITP